MIETFKPGYVVEIWTTSGNQYPKQGLVGEVQAVDRYGVRITFIDWVTHMFLGSDRFVPWREIVGASIATPEHDVHLFIEQIIHRTARRQPDAR